MKTPGIPLTPGRRPELFGLFAVVESKRTILPLKGVECDFSVVSGVGEVSMTQIFRQENDHPVDCEYVFPLPADASVYACEADINGRTIRAQVRERQEARRIAAEKKAAGRRTALVEAERENLFTLGLGNIQPGDLVIVQLKYFQTLRSLAGMPSIEIPFCPGIRYIPGAPLIRSNQGKGVVDDTDEVPDASRITPVRIDAMHPDTAYMEVRGVLDAKFVDEKDLCSPSHSIEVHRAGERLSVSLSHKDEVPDRDFVLRWSEQTVEAVASRAWIYQKEKESYALLEIRAPKTAPQQRAPVDFYFLVDRSGSMAGAKWSKAAEALQSCVQVMGAADRVMVTFFESQFQDFAEGPLAARELLGDRQFQALKNLGTAGGTELHPALQHILEVAARHSGNQPKNLILITDAQIGNESAILELMRNVPDFPVHCFGIDVALNDSLLLALCRQQGGTFHSLNPNDDIAQAVTSLGKTLGQPVLLGLQLSKGWELADSAIPNLYAGQIHYLSAKSSSGKPLELKARTAESRPTSIQFETSPADFQAPYLHWCRSRIQSLIRKGNESDAVSLSIASNLICPLTAFLAWDESEKVPVASHHLVQPGLEFPDRILCAKWDGGAAAAAPMRRQSMLMRLRSVGDTERRFIGSGICENSESLPAAAPRDELDLKRELSDICHKAGIPDWQTALKAIFDWIAEASGVERNQRLQVLAKVIEDIKLHAVHLEPSQDPQAQEKADHERETICQILKMFVAQLPQIK